MRVRDLVCAKLELINLIAVAPLLIRLAVLIGFLCSKLSVIVQVTTKWSLLKSKVDILRDFFFFL